MKTHIKNSIFTVGISFVTALVGCIVIYLLLPGLICRVVLDVHESNLYEDYKVPVEGNIEYTEFFIPQQYSYIKRIVLHMTREDPENKSRDVRDERQAEETVFMEMADQDSHTLVRRKLVLPSEMVYFAEFPVERWVTSGKMYRFTVSFSDSYNLYLTSGPGDIGPKEHQLLEVNGEKVEEALYIEYVYGGYSKKLLAFWFLMLFTVSCFLTDEIQRRRSEAR